MFDMRDKILSFGGYEVCMPMLDPDCQNIIDKGEFWYGNKSKLVLGEPNYCHDNSHKIWRADKSGKVLCTGYALSKDGMWRSHSWVLDITQEEPVIVETTSPREAYFGYQLTSEEAENFIV